MYFPLVRNVSKDTVLRRVVAFGSMLAFVASTGPVGAAEALFASLGPSPAERFAQQQELRLSSDTAACATIDVREVQRSVDQLTAMRRLNAVRPVESAESRNMWRDHAAYVRSILKTKPRNLPLTSYHAMTPVEFATFRAAETAVRENVPASLALKQCPSQALAALRNGGASPLWQSCGPSCPGGIPPTLKIDTNSVNTDYSDVLSSNNVPYAARGYNGGGTQIMAATYSSVTISGLPGTNGPVPGYQTNLNLSGVAPFNASFALPAPSYVPQTGWTVLPGQSYKGQPLSAYLNPTATQPNDYVQIDSQDSYQTTETSAYNYQTSYTFNTTAQRSTLNCVFTSTSSDLGSALMDLGGTIAAIGTIATSTVLFSEIGVPLQVIGAVVGLLGAAVKYVFGPAFGGGCGVRRQLGYRTASGVAFSPNRPTPLCDSSDDDDDF